MGDEIHRVGWDRVGHEIHRVGNHKIRVHVKRVKPCHAYDVM